MIKVCFLLGGFQGNGGIGRVTSILVNSLCNDNTLEIHTISYLQDNRIMLYDINQAVKCHVLYSSPCSMTKAILFKHAIKKVREILQEENIDIVVACGALFYPLGIIACRKTKTKCICWEHTDPATTSDYKFQNICRMFASQRCARMVVLTKSAERYYNEHFKSCNNKIIQIYNPISENAAKSCEYNSDSHKIISVGRLCYQKNFERLIKIATHILPDNPEWIWDIYGDGELKTKLQGLIDENNLSSQVKLKGQVSDLYDRYSDYAFMVMTSRYEGFPMSLIEGAANRLPLVSFDISTGPNEIIIDGVNGYLINSDSDDDMVERIKCLIEKPEIRLSMSKEVYRLTDTFAMERILEQWKTLFSELQ